MGVRVKKGTDPLGSMEFRLGRMPQFVPLMSGMVCLTICGWVEVEIASVGLLKVVNFHQTGAGRGSL